MKNYSIVRIGNDYIVQADDQSVLKIASRRKAAKLVTDAAELLDSHPAPCAPAEPSIGDNPGVLPDSQLDPSEVS